MLPLSPDRAYILYDPAAEARVHVPRWQQQAARHLGAALVVYGTADPAQEATLDLWSGIDVGSTTVKAVGARPGPRSRSSGATTSATRRSSPRRCSSCWSASRRSSRSRRGQVARVHDGLGRGAAVRGLGAKFVQEVNAVTLAVEKLHPDVGASSSSAVRTRRSSSSTRTRRRREDRRPVDERQVRVGHGRHDRQVHDQGRPAARRRS
jgi:hypothetical protein